MSFFDIIRKVISMYHTEVLPITIKVYSLKLTITVVKN